MRNTLIALGIILIIIGGIYGYNHYSIDQLVQHELNSDERNSGIVFDAHYENYVQIDLLVLDLKKISGGKSNADIFRALWQSAYALKDDHFKTVKLEYQGDAKFIIPGDFFKSLGNEYNNENPIYVIRTFPENVLNLEGQHAYEAVYGGVLGVMEAEMDNFNDFAKKWYLNSYQAQ
jgi:hypothetical protein